VREISIAKLYASRIACEVADEAIQNPRRRGLHEGVRRRARLARHAPQPIGAGTDEIMLDVIGRSYGL